MPRSYPPPLLLAPNVEPFTFEVSALSAVASALGLTQLSPDLANYIAHSVACFIAQLSVCLEENQNRKNSDMTVATTRAALEELFRGGSSCEAAIKKFADDGYVIDYITHGRLQPLAKAFNAGDPKAHEVIEKVARERLAELNNHPRIEAATEVLRYFCGRLREIFNAAASLETERTWPNCRAFALVILSAADIKLADFHAHPERLDEYLGTDITFE